MSFPYVIDAPQRLVTVTMPAIVHGREIAETIDAMFRDPRWETGFSTLWDGTAISQLLLEKDDLPSFIALQRTHADIAGPGHAVILVNRTLDHAMARAYGAMMKTPGRQVHVCRSREEALRILASSVPAVNK